MRGIAVVLRALFVVVFLSMVSELGAQSRSVELSGVVTDAQKGVVPGASVAVTNEATGVRQATETNETGLYRIQNLIPGSYRIEVSKTGLKTLVQTGFVMQVGQITRLDAVLEVGAVTEMIQVQGAAPTLQTESAEVGLTVTQQQMEDLPILDRNSISLFNLNASLNVKSTYPMQGNRSANLAMYLNGNAQELRLDAGGQDMAPISDIVSEFRILSNNFSPEFRGVSAFVMETKGGTNGFHGSAYFWLRHRSLMANPWGATTKLPFRRIEPGFTFGGPIKKNKAFFFGAFQRWTITSNNPQFYTFPSNLERQGDFSRTFDRNGNPIPIYDPFSSPRTPFAANRIPTERIDPVGKALMSYYPEPNLTTISPNFTGTRTVDTRQNQPYGRVDYNWNERHRTYGSALWMLVHNDVRYPWAPAIGVFDDDKVYQQWRTYTVGHIYTPSPTWVLTSTFSYLNRTWEGMSPGLGMGYAEKVGLKGTFDSTAFFPGVSVSGYSGIPGRSWAGSGEQIYNRTFSFSQRFANTRGKHMIKFGTEIQPSRANGQLREYPSGNLSFGPQPTALAGAGGNALASLLLGFPLSAALSDQAPLKVGTTYYALYLMDDWKVRRNLTLSLGLRWETQTQATVRRATDNGLNLTGFDPIAINPVSGTPGVITYPGINGPEGITPQSWDLFGPRVGIAWQFTSNTVLRTGGGIFYPTAFGSSGFSLWQPPGYGLPGYKRANFTSPDNGITAPFLLKDGFPPPPPGENPGPGFGAVPVGQSPRLSVSYAPYYGYRVGMNYQYNFALERRLPSEMTFMVGYVANLGRRLTGSRAMNQVHPSLFMAGNAQVRRPFPQYADVNNAFYQGFRSNYHALEARLEKRYSSGLVLLSSYNYGLTFHDSDPWNGYDFRASYRPSGTRHSWVNSWAYDLPFGPGRSWLRTGLLSKILGGWQQAGIFSVQSGQYLDVGSVTNTANGFMTQGVNVVGDPNNGPQTMNQWFNTAAFAFAAPYTLGNAGRGIVIGPGQYSFDANLSKQTKINERFNTEFRADFINALNHSVLCNPNTTLGSPGFGLISCKGAAAMYQGNSYTTAYGNRQIQLGIRFLF